MTYTYRITDNYGRTVFQSTEPVSKIIAISELEEKMQEFEAEDEWNKFLGEVVDENGKVEWDMTKEYKEGWDADKWAEYFNQYLKKANKWMYAGETEIDLSDFGKATEDVLEDIRANAIMSEEDLIAKFQKQDRADEGVTDLWDDIDDLVRKDEGSYYTYNGSYAGPDLHFDIYYDTVEDKTYGTVRVHLGGDARGNFSDAYVMIIEDGDTAESMFYSLYDNYVGSRVYLDLTFDDGSNITFDGEAFDVYNFEFGQGGEKGKAQELAKYFETLPDNWSDKDEFLDKVSGGIVY